MDNLGLIIIIGVIIVVVIALISLYNGLVQKRLRVDEAFAQIEVQLKRRHDLIPNLVETVKGYARHEQATLEAVLAARARAESHHDSPKAQAADENRLVSSLGGLFALAEGYPDLKADRHFLELQRELVNTEDRIQAARRIYNGNVRDLNRRVQSIPSNLVAKLFGFTEADYFEIEQALRTAGPPAVDAGRA